MTTSSRKRRFGLTCPAVALLCALLTAVGGAPAQAAESWSDGATQQRIAEVLHGNPGARQLDRTTVALPGGAVYKAGRAAAASCARGTLCLYPGANYTGVESVHLVSCAFADLGPVWGTDRIRSLINNQTGDPTSYFYNWYASTSSWRYVGFSKPVSRVPHVSAAIRTADAVDPC